VKLDPNKIQRLHHVTLRDPNLDVSRFPDFFILGPQRTASTWLYDCLTLHPRIFMSNGKEIHYFNTINHPQLPDHRSTDLDDYLREFEPWPDRFEAKDRACKKEYGEPFVPLVRGEATASYAAGLDDTVIEDVLTLNPKLRAILAVRDPLERAWSHAKKDLCKEKGRVVREVPDAEFHEFFSSYYQVQCGQYVHMIDRWTEVLPEGHLLVVRFDDVARRPAELLIEVYQFLGVPSDAGYVPPVAREQINATTPDPIPDQHRAVLLDLFAPELARLEQRYGWTWGHSPAE